MKTVRSCYLKGLKKCRELIRITLHIIIGCVHAIKSYIRKTGLTVESNSLTDLTKTLKIIYSL